MAGTAPRWSDWWSAAVQFAGTIWFNVSTFRALETGLSATAERQEVWRPDALGSTAFLVASLLAVHACTLRDRLWDPTSRTWRVAWLKLVGSIAFGAAAIGAYIEPDGTLKNAAVANLGTFVGALCFLAGALLMTPAPSRSPASDEMRAAGA